MGIGRAGAKNKGRISRYLANKCSIASRVDNFSDIPTSVIGEHLKQQVEDRLKFYETGENPAKNIDVMRQAVTEAGDAKEKALKAQKKLEKKQKKRKLQDGDESLDTTSPMDTTAEVSMNGDGQENTPPRKKKKKNKDVDAVNTSTVVEVSEEPQVVTSSKKK